MIFGVLALQGAFLEHRQVLAGLGVETREVRLPAQMAGLAGLILPGGESTTMGLLAREYGFVEALWDFAREGVLWGTCAGAILLSQTSAGSEEERLGLLSATLRRNAFGRQAESFQIPLSIPVLKTLSPPEAPGPGSPEAEGGGDPAYESVPRPFPGVFIRAPKIEEVTSPSVKVLSRMEDGTIVAVQEGKILATVFHPELTGDDRLHRYFVSLASV